MIATANYLIFLLHLCCLPSLHPRAGRRLREEGYSGLIVGLTGDTSEEDRHFFQAHGVDKVLPKPFDIDDFNAIVNSFLASRR